MTLSITKLCHYTECHVLFIVMQNVNILSVIMLNVIMLSVTVRAMHKCIQLVGPLYFQLGRKNKKAF
jgi:hypothetical protein